MKKQKVKSIYVKSRVYNTISHTKGLYFLLSPLHRTYNFTIKVLCP